MDLKAKYQGNQDFIRLPYLLTYERLTKSVGDTHISDISSAHSITFPTLKSLLSQVHEYLTLIDNNGVFAAPVDIPGYHNVIVEPMDMSTILVKIDKNKYKMLDAFSKDIDLMLQNCFHFNEEYSDAYHAGEKLQFAWSLVLTNIIAVLVRDPSKAIILDPNNTTIAEQKTILQND